jgi:hypothetical protein
MNQQFFQDVDFGMPAAHQAAFDGHGTITKTQWVVFAELTETFWNVNGI